MFENLTERLAQVVKKLTGQARLTEDNLAESLEQIRTILIDADVPLAVVTSFLERVKGEALGHEVIASLKPGEVFIKIVYDELVKVLGGTTASLNLQAPAPIVIMVVGLQGAGKTTTIAKLAHWLKNQQRKSVLVASTDIYRPAAREQLQILAEQVGITYGAAAAMQPNEIVQEALNQAKKTLTDVVILDTAGRLHVDDAMMLELENLQQVAQPVETLLVVDSMIGQDAINVAQHFSSRLKLTGVILTKVDGDARGGAALAMREVTRQPIKFIGTGEKIDALTEFHPDRLASRILGLGDIVSLVEDVYQKVDHAKAEKLAKKIQKGHAFDLDDFRTQLQQMRNLGGLSAMIDKLPQLGGALSAASNVVNDQTLARMEAILNSMTIKERRFPAFIRASNKKRIALGSGTSIQEVNRLLKQFEQMQRMMQRFNSSRLKNMLNFFKGN